MNNVHPLFNSKPEQRATEFLKAILLGGASIRTSWLGYGAALNEMKAQHPGKAGERAFGEAVAAAGLDKWPEGCATTCNTSIDRIVRAAAMWAASLTPEELAAVEAQYPNVEVTTKGGFRGLHAKATEAAKPASKIPPPSPAVAKVIEVITPDIEAGKPVDVCGTAAKEGVGRATVDYAAQRVMGRVEGRMAAEAAEPEIDPKTLSMSAQQKLEAAQRKLVKDFKAEAAVALERYRGQVRAELEEEYKAHKAKLETDLVTEIREKHRRLQQVLNGGSAIMTEREYRLVWTSLHPDSRNSVSDEKLAQAFDIMTRAREKMIPLHVSVGSPVYKRPKDELDAILGKRF